MLFAGITTQQVLEMPACRMFSLLKSGRKLKSRSRTAFFSELCDIAIIPQQKVKYYQELKRSYRLAYGISDLKPPGRDLDDPSLIADMNRALSRGLHG